MEAPTTPRIAWWKRLLIAGVTIATVISIYRKLDGEAFLETLRQIRPAWLLAAFGLYGVLILAAIGRWHLAMRLTDSVVHFTASVRATLIGHFFSIVLFTAGIGDFAKGLLYARWYRFPFPVIFAGAKLDRIMGGIGMVLVWLTALGFAMSGGSPLEQLELNLQAPAKWKVGLVCLAIAGVASFVLMNARFRAGLRHFGGAMLEGLRRLLRWPRVMAGGTFFGFVVQGGLSFVLALTLRSLTRTEIDWMRILWLFPLIQLFSTLPLTVAGLGLREAAAMTLLGLYGVPREEAAAAALLSFLVAVSWAAVGGIVLWRESGRLEKQSSQSPVETISVVVPVLNEAEELPATLQRLREIPQISEIIVVDGGSCDGTREVAREFGCHVLDSAPGRGRQLRLGAQQAKGDVVMMVHADTWLPPHTGTAALNCLRDPLVVAGGFWKYFREYPSALLYGSRWRCGFRLVFSRWIAGDQGIFVRRRILEEIGGVPDLELMEEFRLCELLRQKGRLAMAGEKISTSARRFAKFGTIRTLWLMNVIIWKYRLGTPPGELRKLYEGKG